MPDEVLSQSEIDKLLQSINEGSVNADEMKGDESGRKIKVYDFKRPDKFSKDQLRAIQMIHEAFARQLFAVPAVKGLEFGTAGLRGVIGAGTMGSGIAQAFAQTDGYEVCLCDITEEFAANGKKKIEASFSKLIAKGKMDQEKADSILAKITTGLNSICTDCDLVVEAALEKMDVKKAVFKELIDRKSTRLNSSH